MMAGARLYAVQASKPVDPTTRLVDLDMLSRLCVLGRICGGMQTTLALCDGSPPSSQGAVGVVWLMGREITPGAGGVGDRAYNWTPVDDHTGSRTQIFRRLPPREHVPAFDMQASGTPWQWNAREERRWRVRESHKYFERLGGVRANLQRFQMFLFLRRDRNIWNLCRFALTPPSLSEYLWLSRIRHRLSSQAFQCRGVPDACISTAGTCSRAGSLRMIWVLDPVVSSTGVQLYW